MSCGYETQPKSMIEHQPGIMKEIVMLGKKPMADSYLHLWQQACSYARLHSKPEKAQGRACGIYKDITGMWPPRDWNIMDSPQVEICKNVLGRIMYNNIRYAKGWKS